MSLLLFIPVKIIKIIIIEERERKSEVNPILHLSLDVIII